MENIMTIIPLDLAAALRDPGRYFPEPQDIVDAAHIDRSAKLKLLDQWEHDARSLAVAEEEGLSGGETPMLGRIRRAQHQLGQGEPASFSGATKHG
jgi:hypothetical protein